MTCKNNRQRRFEKKDKMKETDEKHQIIIKHYTVTIKLLKIKMCQ